MNQHGFTNIISVFVVIVIIAVAGYFVLIKKPAELKTKEQESKNIVQKIRPTIEQQREAFQKSLANIDKNIAHWNVYKSEIYNFAIKYPRTWHAEDYTFALYEHDGWSKGIHLIDSATGKVFISIEVTKPPGYPPFELLQSEIIRFPDKLVDSKVGGADAKFNTSLKQYVFLQGPFYYELKMERLIGDYLFNEVVSTFKFIK